MTYRVVLTPEAQDDLAQLYAYIAERDGQQRASGYIDRIEALCSALADMPDRGVNRDDLRPGLKLLNMERRVSIGYHVSPGLVTIDRILYGGRDPGTAFLR